MLDPAPAQSRFLPRQFWPIAVLWLFPGPMLFLDRLFDRDGSNYGHALAFYIVLVLGGLVIFALQLFSYGFSLGVAFQWDRTKPSRRTILLMWIASEALIFAGPYTVAAVTTAFATGLSRIVDWRMQYVLWCGTGLGIVIAAHFAAFLLGIRSVRARSPRRHRT